MSINRVANPSGETDIADWAAVRGTLSRVTTQSLFGVASFRYDSDILVTGVRFMETSRMPVIPGNIYTGSAFIKLGSTFTDAHINIAWYDVSDTFISVSSGLNQALTTDWNRHLSTAAAPNNAVKAEVNALFEPDPTVSAAHVFLDGAMFNEGEEIEYLEGEGSFIDQIMAALIAEGFTEGSVTDRERDRLLAKTLETEDKSMADLYEIVGEPPRVTGKTTD